MVLDFSNQTVLITGASRGIGAAAAVLYAGMGAEVVINFRQNKTAAESVLRQITESKGNAATYQADVADFDQCRAMIEWTIKQYGKLDILVNNAGIWKESPVEEITPEKLAETINTNLNGSFYCTSAVVPHMKKRRSGNIVFVSSTAGQRGEAFHSHYAASKGGLISLTKSLASELAPFNIRVNCIAPGWVDTDMSHETLISDKKDRYLSQIPLNRPAVNEEIAWPVIFISSDMASYVTGEILNVNGGSVLVG